MKKLFLFTLGVCLLSFCVMCKKKDNTDDCPACPKVNSFFPSHGKTGDSVRINGENFTTNPDGLNLKVSFNGKDAVIKNVTAGQIITTVPDKCGTGPIRVYYDVELFGESSVPFIYDRVGVTSTFAGKCGSGNDSIDTSNPLQSNLRALTEVFLDEPRGFVYTISHDSKILSRVGPSGVKKIIDVGTLSIQSGACDASGNIYLAFHGFIAKLGNSVTPTLTTIAGSETTKGFVDGKGAVARFGYIYDMIVDDDILYIAEGTGIRKMDIATLTVSTIAGSATAGFADGAALTAKFNNVAAIAMDKNKNLYIADWNNNRIRRLSNGSVITIAGDGTAAVKNGTGTKAQLENPRALAVNNDMTFIYFSDSYVNFMRKINLSTAEVSHFSGDLTQSGSQDGPVETATYFQPKGFAYSKNTDAFFIADYLNCKVRKVTFQ